MFFMHYHVFSSIFKHFHVFHAFSSIFINVPPTDCHPMMSSHTPWPVAPVARRGIRAKSLFLPPLGYFLLNLHYITMVA